MVGGVETDLGGPPDAGLRVVPLPPDVRLVILYSSPAAGWDANSSTHSAFSVESVVGLCEEGKDDAREHSAAGAGQTKASSPSCPSFVAGLCVCAS